jgi:hypothetical protein
MVQQPTSNSFAPIGMPYQNAQQPISSGYTLIPMPHQIMQQPILSHCVTSSMLLANRKDTSSVDNADTEQQTYAQDREQLSYTDYGQEPLQELNQAEASSAAVVNNLNGEYIPMFANEAAFKAHLKKKRKERVVSDYPDVAGQQVLISRLYKAIRNISGVHDSAKVAAGFANDSIPDEAIEIMCWGLMVKSCFTMPNLDD